MSTTRRSATSRKMAAGEPRPANPRKTPAAARKTRKSSSAAHVVANKAIILSLHNEHKYMAKLLSIFRDQLRFFEVGGTPDYNIMHDVMHYMHTFPDVAHHPREDILYRKLAEREPELQPDIDAMFIEHELLAKKSRILVELLNNARKQPGKADRRTIQTRCEDYLAFLDHHMDLEESKLFPRIAHNLTEADWNEIAHDIQPEPDPLFGEHVAHHYQHLYDFLTRRVEQATEDFALAEIIGLSLFTESIGTVSSTASQIVSIVRKNANRALRHNRQSYQKFWATDRRNLHDFVSVSADCAINSYDTVTDIMKDIGVLIRKARTRVAEPYSTRMKLYRDLTRDETTQPSHAEPSGLADSPHQREQV